MIRRNPAWLMLASAALLGLGTSAPPVPESAASIAPSKEYVNPMPEKKERKKKAKVGGGGGGKPFKWRFDKKGNAIDGRGDYRSTKRLRRELLTRLLGLKPTGRQWVKAQKQMREHAPHLLTIHTGELRARMKQAGKL